MILMPWTALKLVGLHAFACFEKLLEEGGNKALVLTMVGLIFFWHLYTPVHELFHVGACLAGGGTVESLALKPQYGGTILAAVFPFVVPESDYAGQLTGFSTPNYLVYAFVDYAPYLLSLFGVALTEWVRRRGSTLLFGLAVILTFIPLMSIPGDYYEAMSLVTTQVAEQIYPAQAVGFLISDDVFASLASLSEAGMLQAPIIILTAMGLLGAVYTALVTVALQVWVAQKIYGRDVCRREEVEA